MPTDNAAILGGARTPIGRYGGSLSRIRTDDLLGLALGAAAERVAVEPSLGLSAGVESMSRSGWALMKGEEAFSPAVPSSCSTPCGRGRVGLRTRSCWWARPTWR